MLEYAGPRVPPLVRMALGLFVLYIFLPLGEPGGERFVGGGEFAYPGLDSGVSMPGPTVGSPFWASLGGSGSAERRGG